MRTRQSMEGREVHGEPAPSILLMSPRRVAGGRRHEFLRGVELRRGSAGFEGIHVDRLRRHGGGEIVLSLRGEPQ